MKAKAFEVKLSLASDAMQNVQDIANVLQLVAREVTNVQLLRGTRGVIRDGNGNTVGHWRLY